MLIDEEVYIGRDNTIILSLTSNKVAINHQIITRVQVQAGATLLDSNSKPDYFDFSTTDKLILKFGPAGLTAGHYPATLYIFDAGNINGRVWGKLMLVVE